VTSGIIYFIFIFSLYIVYVLYYIILHHIWIRIVYDMLYIIKLGIKWGGNKWIWNVPFEFTNT
jgi:hypothetical protein